MEEAERTQVICRMKSGPKGFSMRPSTANTSVFTFTQPIDHFRFAERRTFEQRVFTHDAHWRRGAAGGGTVLFYCGNEANVELYVNATGLMWERAASLGALLVWAEHRYYGASLPLGARSADNGSTLQWLTKHCKELAAAEIWHASSIGKRGVLTHPHPMVL